MTTTPTSPPGRGRAIRAAVIAGLAGLTVAGTAAAVFGRVQHRADNHVQFPAPTHLRVKGEAGDMTIRTADVSRVEVDYTARWSGPDAVGTPTLRDGVLQVRGCSAKWWKLLVGLPGQCDATYDIVVPPGTSLDIDSSLGRMTLDGRFGPISASGDLGTFDASAVVAPSLTVTWGVGDVRLARAVARQAVTTDVGEVHGEQLTSKELEAKADIGTVDLRFAASPTRVEARSGVGGVTVWVPTGRYSVDASSGSGSTNVDRITVDRSSPRTITVRSDTGDVEVRGTP